MRLFSLQPGVISKLVVVDTAPEHIRFVQDTQFPALLTAMQGVVMNPRLTLSQVRHQVAAQLEPVVKVNRCSTVIGVSRPGCYWDGNPGCLNVGWHPGVSDTGPNIAGN